MKKVLIATAFALVVLASGRTMANESLRDTIQSREDEWSPAYNANSKDGLAAFYEEGGVLIPPGSAPINGRAAIAEFIFSRLFPQLKDIKLVTDEVRPFGPDHALEMGYSEYTAIAEDGSRSPRTDNYQVAWHKGDDGVWSYITDMFNER